MFIHVQVAVLMKEQLRQMLEIYLYLSNLKQMKTILEFCLSQYEVQGLVFQTIYSLLPFACRRFTWLSFLSRSEVTVI